MSFVLRRLGLYAAAFFVAATINFVMPRLMPGNPVDIMFSQAEGRMPPEAKAALLGDLRLHRRAAPRAVPAPILTSVFTWDLGISIKFYPLTGDRGARTRAALDGAARRHRRRCSAFALGSLLGINAAWRRGSRFDTIVSPGALVMQSIPAVVLALTTLFVFGLALRMAADRLCLCDPALDPGFDLHLHSAASLYHAVMPVFSLVFVHLGGYLVTMRNNMIGQLGEDYVVMGIAKGLSDARVTLQLRGPQRAAAEHHRLRLHARRTSSAARW